MSNELKQQVEMLQAKLEAHIQIVNETMVTSINLRTNLVIFQKALQEERNKVIALQKQVEDLTPKPLEAPSEA